jgi:acyl-CoA synthetase (AMP-forming)/AMP-acid ligase II
VLSTHPSILEVGVVAVADSHWGERPKAFVTVKEPSSSSADTAAADADASTLPAALLQWARDNRALSRFMVPREFEVVRELPKTSTGKIKKNVLREWARGNRDAK